MQHSEYIIKRTRLGSWWSWDCWSLFILDVFPFFSFPSRFLVRRFPPCSTRLRSNPTLLCIGRVDDASDNGPINQTGVTYKSGVRTCRACSPITICCIDFEIFHWISRARWWQSLAVWRKQQVYILTIIRVRDIMEVIPHPIRTVEGIIRGQQFSLLNFKLFVIIAIKWTEHHHSSYSHHAAQERETETEMGQYLASVVGEYWVDKEYTSWYSDSLERKGKMRRIEKIASYTDNQHNWECLWMISLLSTITIRETGKR